MRRRGHLSSLFILAGALVVGAAVFVLVGQKAGALYGAAALILGLLFQQKLARSGTSDAEADEIAKGRRRKGRLRFPRGRRAALREELISARAELADREEAVTHLAKQLTDQQERIRLLQASFAERVDQLTASVHLHKTELDAAHDARASSVAAHERDLGRAREALAQRDAAVGALTRELEAERLKARELAGRLADLTAAHRDELARVAWSWRAHVEEISALENALDTAVDSS